MTDSQTKLNVSVKFHRYKNTQGTILGTNVETMTFHNSLTCGEVKDMIKQQHKTYHKEFNEENGVKIASRLKLFVPQILNEVQQKQFQSQK